jgi:hypothetical protein
VSDDASLSTLTSEGAPQSATPLLDSTPISCSSLVGAS